MKSMFITFEGNDGSGKSSVIEAIREELTKRGYDIVLTREPGGSKIAEKIREVISSLKMAGLESDDIDLEMLKSILNGDLSYDEARKIILDSII